MTHEQLVEETALNIAMMNNAFFVTAELDVKEYGDKLLEILTTTAERVRKETIGEWYVGKRMNVFGGDYVVTGVSTMIYDEDCEGEPEWKVTNEIQEVAIAKFYEGISYQKPSWHKVNFLLEEMSKSLSTLNK